MPDARRLISGIAGSVGSFDVVSVVVITPLFWLSMLMIPGYPVMPLLDMSWTGALPYFAARGFHHGTQVIFTHGPLGYLAGFAYTGYLPAQRTVWELISRGVEAVLFSWALLRLPPVPRVALSACILLFLGNFEEAHTFAIVVVGLLLLSYQRVRPWLPFLLSGLLAVLSLVKFTYFLQSGVALASVAVYYVARSQWRQLSALITGFLCGLVCAWSTAGQSLGDFPEFFANSLQITVGYNTAMATPSQDPALVWLAVALAIAFTLQLGWLCRRSAEKVRAILGALLLAIMLFLLWKHAFTRWENHSRKFFALYPELLLASWLLANPRWTSRCWPIFALNAAAVVASLFGLEVLERGAVLRSLPHLSAQMQRRWSTITNYQRFDDDRRARLAEAERQHALPRIKEIVGDATIDVLGNQQGIALLNRLNYVPRPIFQSYSAYTPKLIRLNGDHYRSAAHPAFVLSRLAPLDERLLASEDALVQVELLRSYRPVLSERGWQLWQLSQAARRIQFDPIGTSEQKIGRFAALPKPGLVWAELHVELTRLGRLVGLVYKTPSVFLDLRDSTGQTTRYRIAPTMATSGFFINPMMKSDADLVAVAKGEPAHEVEAFRVAVEDDGKRLFKRKVTVALSELRLAE